MNYETRGIIELNLGDIFDIEKVWSILEKSFKTFDSYQDFFKLKITITDVISYELDVIKEIETQNLNTFVTSGWKVASKICQEAKNDFNSTFNTNLLMDVKLTVPKVGEVINIKGLS